MIPPNDLTGLILAGGEGRRMGGRDKGLELLAGRPLVAHVSERFAGQVSELVISANRHPESYRRYGDRVVADRALNGQRDAFHGPLMGLYAGLRTARTPWLLVAPCDTPALPRDFAARLIEGLGDADIAVAHDGQRVHPVIALTRTDLAQALGQALDAGQRSVREFYTGLKVSTVSMADCADALVNVNTPADKARLEATLAREAS
ncbi:molybdenum cofactor guanylyltransferase MobA [Halomonas piscis]|uniref:molybdenum cofactor guanylyltransferase MobA n=1 Tax=Halomonas piscis TaxID=3031727 RepID=UPI00289BBA2D|nr:molybdenum cofactor guanylyltransferase MobA [Halomonas piscis]